MPEALRGSLGRGFLGVRVCGDEEYVTGRLLDLLGGCRGAIVVGDFACLGLVSAGYVPGVCVVDGTTRRVEAQPLAVGLFDRRVECVNPRSHVCLGAVEALLEAVRGSERGERVLVLVRGEEDLLALPAIARGPPGWCVVYGLPGCGAELVVIDEDTAEVARRVLELFEEVEL